MSLLSARNIKSYYFLRRGSIKAVDGVSLDINYGEVLGIAGESGCGKSTFANVLMMNVNPPLRLVEGKVVIDNYDLTKMRIKEVRSRIWGYVVSMIPQGALNALIPIKKVKDLIKEVIKLHRKDLNDEAILDLIGKRFQDLHLSDEALNMYPHELSGGMKQRVVIAISTLLNPKLLIADEPTSALDVTTQKQSLKMMIELKKRGIIESVIHITHDIATLRQTANRVAIMYAGKIVEVGNIDKILYEPLHPYTKGLVNAIITPEPEVKKRGLSYIPGETPDLLNPPLGCHFHPRCQFAKDDLCRIKEPPLIEIEKGHFLACHLYT